ncbi:MAG: uroporphyrinogen-III C-methyltransferase [Candidatus Hatepunaea meridiana]|nr:uroporphyrinogen-III C-methyltransferase [Candidatus Hatepunaea meridiana]
MFLVGAGPGHPGLITLYGHELLRKCDVVVYDDLAPYELVAALPSHIERYYVGKRAGRHSKPQKETNSLLVSLAKEGKKVVRLKGGDPFIFGRGGEEVSCLKTAGIPFEIVPGVTAVSAVAAGAGIPLTDRRDSSWLLMATGHEASSASLPVPWEEIAGLKGGTIAVYMGVSKLAGTVDKLLTGGSDPNTKTAVVENGYTGSQRVIKTSLKNLPQECVEKNINPPAIIIIGDVVKQMDQLNWKTPGILSDKRILVTRPYEQAARLCGILREYGADTLSLPTIRIEPYEDFDGWLKFEQLCQVIIPDTTKEMINVQGWLVFTSRAGVTHFINELFERGYDIRCLFGYKIAAIGPGTTEALLGYGLKTDLEPDVSTVAELSNKLKNAYDFKGKIVIRVRGNLSDNTIEDALNSEGAEIVKLTVYRTTIPEWEPHWLNAINETPPDYITFTSGSTVEGFVKIFGKVDAVRIALKSSIISIGPVTTRTAKKYGIRVASEARQHTISGLSDVLVRYAKTSIK